MFQSSFKMYVIVYHWKNQEILSRSLFLNRITVLQLFQFWCFCKINFEKKDAYCQKLICKQDHLLKEITFLESYFEF